VRERSSSVKREQPVTDDNTLLGVWFLARSVRALLDDALAESGLDADEYAVYSLLAVREGATPTELATWLAAPPTTVSSYVKRLEGRQHLQRVAHPSDGRSYRMTLTPKGLRAHRRAARLYVPVLRQVESTLGQAEPQVRTALSTLRGAVGEVHQSISAH
jgi:DNA-binding MarR family transcriptional regulator